MVEDEDMGEEIGIQETKVSKDDNDEGYEDMESSEAVSVLTNENARTADIGALCQCGAPELRLSGSAKSNKNS
ncbi:unnamed protein product [Angiostrongylus costaricensis]|uniref:Uncharacterized protein n=1 Tax=Angiostrongylus costaricensis TaxID=334426 RepID=A0A0R3PP56_ANGCS|nr:unnamed protein product [Angiostrongylus costaricensis]